MADLWTVRMTRDPESIMDAERQDALHQEARDSERRELPDYDRPTAWEVEPSDPPLAPTPEEHKLIREAFAEAMALQAARLGRGAL